MSILARDARPPLPTGPFRLGMVAPRLALARDQRIVEMRSERQKRRSARYELYRAEQCLAHRELQLVRAQSTGDGRYIAKRDRMLSSARERFARARTEAERVGA